MSECYYVISASEYRQALYACLMRAEAMRTESSPSPLFQHYQEQFEKAEAACRARPVKKVDGPFVAASGQLWEEDV